MSSPIKNRCASHRVNNNTLCSVDISENNDSSYTVETKFTKLFINADNQIAVHHGGVSTSKTKLPLLCKKEDRIIGHPKCIGYNGRYSVLKYITSKDLFMRFILLDTWKDEVLQVFPDFSSYFCRDILDPVECIMEPVCSFSTPAYIRWILRLPQAVLTPFKWSVMFLYAHNMKTGLTEITDTLRDRRWQGVAFHPQKHQLCLSLVNTYGYKCKVVKMDSETLQVIGQRDFKSPVRLRNVEEEEGTVAQSAVQYSNDGESILIVSCLTCIRGTFCLFQFDSLSLACLRCYRTTNMISMPVSVEDSIGISITSCGSAIKLWKWEGQQGAILTSVSLAKPSSLSSICRTVIKDSVLL